MANYKTAFGSYLKAEDLQGKAIKATIEHVGLEDFKSDKGSEKRLVCHFAGKDKTLLLNRTNADALAAIFGDDYDHWTGPVVLYPDTTMFGGKRVPCLRVRAVKGAAKPEPEPEPDEEDNTPFDDSEPPF